MRAQLPDEAGRVPGGAAGEPSLLQQHDVAPAEFGQMIGDRASDHAAADDDRARAVGKGRGCHAAGSLHAARQSYQQKITNYHFYFASTMISQPMPVQAEASCRSGMRSTITPVHLSMLGMRNGVRRVNLVWSASR